MSRFRKVPNVPFNVSRSLGLALLCTVVLVGVVGLSISASNAKKQADAKSDSKVFHSAMRTLLTTEGITCTVKDDKEGIKTDQVVSLDLERQHHATSLTTIRQEGTEVTTEALYFPDKEYVKYTTLKIKGDKDTSQLLNRWGEQPIENTNASFYGKTALGGCIVPIAGLSDQEADKLMEGMKKASVFKTDFMKATTSDTSGQDIRAFAVTIKPEPYISYMKQVAKASNLKDLESINKDAFAENQTDASLVFFIDAKNLQLKTIHHQASSRTINFTDYGKAPEVIQPETAVPAEELRRQLRELN